MLTGAEPHVTRWGERGEPVVLVHGSNSADPDAIWADQRSLADRYRLLVLHRRGYGRSASVFKPDFETDVHDIAMLLGEGAHLVGFSYGGVLALLVAARRPELVRSLTLIEPPAFDVARGNPAVEVLVARMAHLWVPDRNLTPEQFITGFAAALGEPPREPVVLSPESRKSVTQTMNELPPWDARIPLEPIAAAPFPRLVVSGEWQPSIEAVANLLTERLGAQRLYVPGAGHTVHSAAAEEFNARLENLIASAGRV